MLFPYIYVPHQMDKMHGFIDFIFYEVWCKAPISGAFRLDLFAENPELKEVMEAFFYSDAKGADFFYVHVERIFGFFATLTPTEIDQFKRWYQSNNDIEKVCANDPALQIARYADIRAIRQNLSDQIATFFKGLYSKDLLELKAIGDKIGKIDDHYQAFMTTNKMGKCPFCGIYDMKGIYHSTREAYDHYLPKGLYPFNSINFHNLVPACHNCNSSYKTSQDPAFTPKDPAGATNRRKIFYPYANHTYRIELTINLIKPDIDRLIPGDIQLEFGPTELSEEIKTWEDVYGIEERYKAKCCSESDGKYWVTQVLDEWKEDGRSANDFLNTLKRQAAKSPFADCNFLKEAFLKACDRAGIFNQTPI
ncbi:MAG TPA: hypothetical protein DET40_08855 [Lentisphaeria bacterium]|nr:MAG: hypothetical protein A2X45_19530 [Lentisphaerae bacterium GWF2_50_93]HCE43644.1 hypothetical protein [Lentisphaeria bacterium]